MDDFNKLQQAYDKKVNEAYNEAIEGHPIIKQKIELDNYRSEVILPLHERKNSYEGYDSQSGTQNTNSITLEENYDRSVKKYKQKSDSYSKNVKKYRKNYNESKKNN